MGSHKKYLFHSVLFQYKWSFYKFEVVGFNYVIVEHQSAINYFNYHVNGKLFVYN